MWRWWLEDAQGKPVREVVVESATISMVRNGAGRGTAQVNCALSDITRSNSLVLTRDGIEIWRGFIRRSRGQPEGKQHSLTLEDGLARLAKYTAWPAPDGDFSAHAYDVFTGAASDAIYHYVEVNAGTLAIGTRQATWLRVLPADERVSVGRSVVVKARFDKLLDLLAEIADVGQVIFGFRDGLFQVWEPSTLSSMLSEGLGTLSDASYAFYAGDLSAVVVGGSGEGISRQFAVVTDPVGLGQIGWAERFLNASRHRDLEVLRDLGALEIQKRKRGWSLSGLLTAVETPGFRPFVDWQLGDVFRVRIGDEEMLMRVDRAQIQVQEGGLIFKVGLSESGHPLPYQAEDVSWLEKRVDLLESQ